MKKGILGFVTGFVAGMAALMVAGLALCEIVEAFDGDDE